MIFEDITIFNSVDPVFEFKTYKYLSVETIILSLWSKIGLALNKLVGLMSEDWFKFVNQFIFPFLLTEYSDPYVFKKNISLLVEINVLINSFLMSVSSVGKTLNFSPLFLLIKYRALLIWNSLAARPYYIGGRRWISAARA